MNKQSLGSYYDELPYSSYSYAASSPEHMEAVASLFGLESPRASQARVLELGCASGGNLIPLAIRNPALTAWGIDISSVQIEAGRRQIEASGLTNVALDVVDFTTLDPQNTGRFDYIVCHGLYSWISMENQEAMLALCGKLLADDGVVFVSHNVYPGWKAKEVVRDAMLWHCKDRDNAERASYARAMLGFMQKFTPKDGVTHEILKENMGLISKTGDDYLAHDYLEPENNPGYFNQFAARASGHGLAYLAEADPSMMMPERYDPTLASVLNDTFSADQINKEQYLDFVLNRAFRQTLLSRSNRTNTHRIDRNSLLKLHFSCSFSGTDGASRLDGSTQDYMDPDGRAIHSSSNAVKKALDFMRAAYPGTIGWPALLAQVKSALPNHEAALADEKLKNLLVHLITHGLVRMRKSPVQLVSEAGLHPTIDRAVRMQLHSSGIRHVSNAWHDTVDIDGNEAFIYPFMDGTRDRSQLEAMLADRGIAVDIEEIAAAAAAKMVLVSAPTPA